MLEETPPPTTTTSPSNELPDLCAPPARSRVGSFLATEGIVYSSLIAPSVFWGYFTWFFVFLIRRGGGLRHAPGGVLFSASSPPFSPHPSPSQEDRRLRGVEFDRLRGEGSRKGPSAGTERLHAGVFPFCFWRAFFFFLPSPSPAFPPSPLFFCLFFFFLPLPLQPEEETLSDRRSEMTREPSWKATPARTRGGEEKATNWKGGE